MILAANSSARAVRTCAHTVLAIAATTKKTIKTT
jgi:hypothetical protein